MGYPKRPGILKPFNVLYFIEQEITNCIFYILKVFSSDLKNTRKYWRPIEYSTLSRLEKGNGKGISPLLRISYSSILMIPNCTNVREAFRLSRIYTTIHYYIEFKIFFFTKQAVFLVLKFHLVLSSLREPAYSLYIASLASRVCIIFIEYLFLRPCISEGK